MKINAKWVCFMLFLLLSPVIWSQVNKADEVAPPTGSTVVTVKLKLTDGTSIWGIYYAESVDEIVVQDFNSGIIKLSRSKLRSFEKIILDTVIVVETTNGSVFIGNAVDIRNSSLLVQSNTYGYAEIKLNSIAKIQRMDAYLATNKPERFKNPNATRYFFAPSAIPLRRGEGYYQNAYLLANSVNVGITNNISVGGGVVIPLLFYVTPKISYKLGKNFYAGAGVLFTQSFIQGFDLSAGIGYGLVTVGNMEHNFTIGGGYGFAKMNKEYRETPMPIITLNGMTRISKKLSLVTENWLIPRGGYNVEVEKTDSAGMKYFEMQYLNKNFYSYAASVGLRLMPGIKTSVDFSVVAIKANPNNNLFVIPYLDFVYKFE
ncbi:MAG: hypothetical protein ACK50A_00695 [Sphingobacteriaceae bacterium]